MAPFAFVLAVVCQERGSGLSHLLVYVVRFSGYWYIGFGTEGLPFEAFDSFDVRPTPCTTPYALYPPPACASRWGRGNPLR